MRPARDGRKAKIRWILFTLFLSVFGIVIGCKIFYTLMTSQSNSRYTIAVVGEPHYILSWDTRENTFILVPYPPDVRIEATHGYGTYPSNGLFALDVIEKRHGQLYTQSLEDAFGIPVQYVLDRRSIPILTDADNYAVLQDLFSLSHLYPLIRPNSSTTIPWWLFVRLSIAVLNVGATSITEIKTEDALDVFAKETLPDGSIVRVFNPLRFDAVVGTLFEEKELREEGLTVTIENSTTVAGLAQKAARLIEKSGIHVLSVGTGADTNVSSCQIIGTKQILRSKTVSFISHMLMCAKRESEVQGQTDITVVLGSEFKDRYEPYKK